MQWHLKSTYLFVLTWDFAPDLLISLICRGRDCQIANGEATLTSRIDWTGRISGDRNNSGFNHVCLQPTLPVSRFLLHFLVCFLGKVRKSSKEGDDLIGKLGGVSSASLVVAED